MANITFQADRCSECGLCVENCHEGALRLVDSDFKRDQLVCDGCAHCVAICPQRALSWQGMPAVSFERSQLPSRDQLLELFQERRSIRAFKQTAIERALLQEIATCGVYAPTHNHIFTVIIIDAPELIAELDGAILSVNNRIYRLIYRNWLVRNPVIMALANLLGFGDDFRKAEPKLENVLRRGSTFSSTPAAILLVVGRKNVPLAEASAQYALANMMYYAQLNGVGTCLWGNASLFLDKNRSIRQRLGLASYQRIYGGLFMGYPRVRFSNKVSGKALPVRWNTAQSCDFLLAEGSERLLN